MTEELKSKIICQQDIIGASIGEVFVGNKLFSINPKILYKDIFKCIFSDEEILNKLDINNLLKILTKAKSEGDEIFEKVRNIAIKRLQTEEYFMEDVDTNFMLVTMHKSDQVMNILGQNVVNDIMVRVQEEIKQFKGTHWQNVVSKFTKLQDFTNFIKYYKEGIFDEEKRIVLEQMLEKNENILEYFNFGLFKDEIFNQMPLEFIEYISNFPNLSQRMLIIQKNNPKLYSIFAGRVNSYRNLIEHYDEIKNMIQEFSSSCFELTPEKLKHTDIDNLLEWINIKAKHESDILGKEKDLPIEYTEDYLDVVRNYYTDKYNDCVNKEKEYRQKIKDDKIERERLNKLLETETDPDKILEYKLDLLKFSTFSTNNKEAEFREKKINFYLKRKYLLSLEEAKKLLKEYGDDLDNLPDIEEKKFFEELKFTLENIENVDEMFEKDTRFYSITEINNIKSAIARECAKSYASNLKELENKVKQIILDKDPEFYESVEVDNQKIDIVKLTGKFDMFMHSTDSGFIVKKELDENYNFEKSWNNSKNKADHILSTVYVNQDFMGMPPLNNNGVMYGFASIPTENIRLMGVTDINTYSREFAFNSTTKQYMSAKTMPYSSRRVYSEFALEKTTPDYVVMFDDSSNEVKNNTYTAAKQLGIPVIYIDKQKIVEKQTEDLESLIQSFEETQDVSVLSTLINKYETNVAGWLLNRTNDEDESHTNGIDNNRFAEKFDEIGSKIETIISNYLTTIQLSDEDKSNELVCIATILLKEKQLYEDSKSGGNEKKISPTQFSLDDKGITEKLNETFQQKGMSEYRITEETTLDKYLKIKDIAKNAICRERITMSEVNQAKQIESKNMEAIDIC